MTDMIIKNQARNLFIFTVIVLFVALSFLAGDVWTAQGAEIDSYVVHTPPVPAVGYKYSGYRTGGFDVAKVFGRSHGCQDSDIDFITDVNDAAVRAGLDSKIFASTIATESSCNQFAVSSKGAIGYSQVMPTIHKETYDFSTINLFNRKDNLRVGAEIESRYIQQSGVVEGIRRYNGAGPDADLYAAKVMTLAGVK